MCRRESTEDSRWPDRGSWRLRERQRKELLVCWLISDNRHVYLPNLTLSVSLSLCQEYDRDRRVYQHHLDLERAEQLKRPTEDLLVADTVSFPPLTKLDWMKLPSQAFADLLMVVQFASSFQEFLQLDQAPTLPALFCSLFNHHSEILSNLFVQFLRAALFDPGSNALTTAGL